MNANLNLKKKSAKVSGTLTCANILSFPFTPEERKTSSHLCKHRAHIRHISVKQVHSPALSTIAPLSRRPSPMSAAARPEQGAEAAVGAAYRARSRCKGDGPRRSGPCGVIRARLRCAQVAQMARSAACHLGAAGRSRGTGPVCT